MCEWEPYPIYRETLRALGQDHEFERVPAIRVMPISENGSPLVIEGWYAR